MSLSQVNDNWAFDSPTVAESVVEHLNLSEMRVEVNDCFDEEALRLLVESRRRSSSGREFEGRKKLVTCVSDLVESGVEDEERNVEGVEHQGTGTRIVSVATCIDVVRTRGGGGVVTTEEEVKFFKDRGLNFKRGHGRGIVRVNVVGSISSKVE